MLNEVHFRFRETSRSRTVCHPVPLLGGSPTSSAHRFHGDPLEFMTGFFSLREGTAATVAEATCAAVAPGIPDAEMQPSQYGRAVIIGNWDLKIDSSLSIVH